MCILVDLVPFETDGEPRLTRTGAAEWPGCTQVLVWQEVSLAF